MESLSVKCAENCGGEDRVVWELDDKYKVEYNAEREEAMIMKSKEIDEICLDDYLDTLQKINRVVSEEEIYEEDHTGEIDFDRIRKYESFLSDIDSPGYRVRLPRRKKFTNLHEIDEDFFDQGSGETSMRKLPDFDKMENDSSSVAELNTVLPIEPDRIDIPQHPNEVRMKTVQQNAKEKLYQMICYVFLVVFFGAMLGFSIYCLLTKIIYRKKLNWLN